MAQIAEQRTGEPKYSDSKPCLGHCKEYLFGGKNGSALDFRTLQVHSLMLLNTSKKYHTAYRISKANTLHSQYQYRIGLREVVEQ